MAKRHFPIYILHGWAVDRHNKHKWDEFITSFESLGYTVEFLHFPGLSSDLDDVWNLTDYVTWAAGQISTPGILIGHSFGGQVATRLASTHPDKVKALVLIDSAGIRDNTVKLRIKRALFMAAAKVGRVVLPFSVFRNLLYKAAGERDYNSASPILKQTMAAVIHEEVIADLPKIVVPTLIIWGGQDRVTPVKMAGTFANGITGSVLKVIPTARHSPQFTHTIETLALITTFLDKLV